MRQRSKDVGETTHIGFSDGGTLKTTRASKLNEILARSSASMVCHTHQASLQSCFHHIIRKATDCSKDLIES